eukprot:scaffold905_cov70-Phaeocystis_antarctica.AAC.3
MHGSLRRSYSAESSAERLRDQVCLALRAAAVSMIGAEASSSVAGVPRCLPAHFLCRRCGGLARPGSTAARRSRVGSIIAPTLCIVAPAACVPSEAPRTSRARGRLSLCDARERGPRAERGDVVGIYTSMKTCAGACVSARPHWGTAPADRRSRSVAAQKRVGVTRSANYTSTTT